MKHSDNHTHRVHDYGYSTYTVQHVPGDMAIFSQKRGASSAQTNRDPISADGNEAVRDR